MTDLTWRGAADRAWPPRDGLVPLLPPPWQMPIVTAAVTIGFLLVGIQLWLLTVALDLYLGGSNGWAWLIAIVSGAIFLGGLLLIWVLERRPRVRHPNAAEVPPAFGAGGRLRDGG